MTAIYENSNYKVTIGTSTENTSPHYLIINKKFDVVETETQLYPQAIKYADDLDAAIFAHKDIKAEKDSVIKKLRSH